LVLLTAAAGLLMAALAAVVYRVRRNPAERERRRRLKVNELGRMGDGLLTDAHEGTLYYSYTAGGVDYTASQDVHGLEARVPADFGLIIGPVTLKYLVRNPANSIVVCEHWSGLRIKQHAGERET
jgi:hypothetical protein